MGGARASNPGRETYSDLPTLTDSEDEESGDKEEMLSGDMSSDDEDSCMLESAVELAMREIVMAQETGWMVHGNVPKQGPPRMGG